VVNQDKTDRFPARNPSFQHHHVPQLGEEIVEKINLACLFPSGIFAGIMIDMFEFALNGKLLAGERKALRNAYEFSMGGRAVSLPLMS
jgi:hypothetical protein